MQKGSQPLLSAEPKTKPHCLLDPKIKLSAAGESTPGILVQPVPLVETVPGARFATAFLALRN